ncbi:MAG: hypothetical protein ACRYGR_00185 [Janthinobacterium lividum]
MSTFYSDLDAGIADIVTEMFGTATLTTIGSTYAPRTDKKTETQTARQIAAIRVEEETTDANGVLVTTTVAYTREAPGDGDKITIGTITNVVRSVSPIDPAGTGALLYKAVLS